MKTKNLLLYIFILFLFTPLSGSAQDESEVMAFLGVALGDSIQQSEETEILEKMIVSHLFRIGQENGFSVVSPNNKDELRVKISRIEAGKYTPDLSADPLPARYFIRANLYYTEKLYLNLEIISGDSGDVYAGTLLAGEKITAILSKLKAEVSHLFSTFLPEASPSADISSIETPTFPLISGKWKGDKGLESITINKNGKAEAAIDGWNTMQLKVDIQGNNVIVRQNEPNAPKLYMGVFPYETAVQLVNKVRPMTWVFQLSEDGSRLEGVKETSYIEVSDGKVINVDNSYTRKAVWTKMNE